MIKIIFAFIGLLIESFMNWDKIIAWGIFLGAAGILIYGSFLISAWIGLITTLLLAIFMGFVLAPERWF